MSVYDLIFYSLIFVAGTYYGKLTRRDSHFSLWKKEKETLQAKIEELSAKLIAQQHEDKIDS